MRLRNQSQFYQILHFSGSRCHKRIRNVLPGFDDGTTSGATSHYSHPYGPWLTTCFNLHSIEESQQTWKNSYLLALILALKLNHQRGAAHWFFNSSYVSNAKLYEMEAQRMWFALYKQIAPIRINYKFFVTILHSNCCITAAWLIQSVESSIHASTNIPCPHKWALKSIIRFHIRDNRLNDVSRMAFAERLNSSRYSHTDMTNKSSKHRYFNWTSWEYKMKYRHLLCFCTQNDDDDECQKTKGWIEIHEKWFLADIHSWMHAID